MQKEIVFHILINTDKQPDSQTIKDVSKKTINERNGKQSSSKSKLAANTNTHNLSNAFSTMVILEIRC